MLCFLSVVHLALVRMTPLATTILVCRFALMVFYVPLKPKKGQLPLFRPDFSEIDSNSREKQKGNRADDGVGWK